MKCLKCNRRVKDADVSRFNHVIRYHPELLISRLGSVLNESSLISVGEIFGQMTKRALDKAYGIAKRERV